MAFRSLVSGPECAAGSNPMAQVAKQLNEDRSLHKDAVVPPHEVAGPSTFRTVVPEISRPDDNFAEKFFDRNEHVHPGTLFREAIPHVGSGVGAKDWAAEFSSDARMWEVTVGEQDDLEEAFKRASIQDVWRGEFLERPPLPDVTESAMPPEFEQAFQKNFDWASEFVLKQDKGKRKVVKQDNASWEERFAAAQREVEGRKTKDTADTMSKDEFKAFEKLWQDCLRGGADVEDYLDPLEFEREFANMHDTSQLGEYIFEPNNPYLNHIDPLNEGKRLVEMDGSLSEAALAFESAVQKDPENSLAWTWLGNTQAQNEKEDAAIRALERAVEIDGNNLDALLSLAVSYTNENFQQQSRLTLERWLTAKYPDLVAAAVPTDIIQDTHSRVRDLFLLAARSAPEGQNMDPDVQVGLGVLFYETNEYEKAVDCFVTALKTRPKDYLLWNRLGATLANSGRSEEAIEAYHKALEIKPTFVRARYNLGVSCVTIGCYREAAEHLLSAWSMHQTGTHGNDDVNASSSLRDTLERTFLFMNREDLSNKLAMNDVNIFRDEFEF